MDLDALLRELRSREEYRECLAHVEDISPCEPQVVPLSLIHI